MDGLLPWYCYNDVGMVGTLLANLGVVRAHERNRFSRRSWIFWFGRACATLHCVGSSEVSRMHRLSFQCVVCRFCASIAHPTGELRHQDASAIRSCWAGNVPRSLASNTCLGSTERGLFQAVLYEPWKESLKGPLPNFIEDFWRLVSP